jgi:hypothetical protein
LETYCLQQDLDQAYHSNLLEKASAFLSDPRLLTRVNTKLEQIRPAVMTMAVKHSLSLRHLVHVQVCHNKPFFCLAKVFNKLAPVKSDDTSPTSTTQMVERTVAEFLLVNASLGVEGIREDDKTITFDRVGG